MHDRTTEVVIPASIKLALVPGQIGSYALSKPDHELVQPNRHRARALSAALRQRPF